jgi:vesicle coat complex subunit
LILSLNKNILVAPEMSAVPLYITISQEGLSERKEIRKKLESTNESEKVEALETMIVLMSQGHDFSDHVNYTIKCYILLLHDTIFFITS